MKRQNIRAEFVLKPAQIKQLIYAHGVSYRDRCILKLLAYTGIRRDEVRRLTVQDINIGLERITVIGKGSKERVIPVPGDLLSDLQHLIGKRRRGAVFQPQGAKSEEKTLTNMQINRVVANAGKKAGLTSPNPSAKTISPHLLRHSFAHAAKAAGMRIDMLSKIMGHSSTKITMDMYGTPNMDETQDEYKKKMVGVFG